jgi:hypothetical protein
MQTKSRWMRDGISVGLVAYLAVAVFYSAFDLLASRGAFFTVNLLGRAVFRGLRDPAVLQFPVALDISAAFWYNAVHLAVSLGIGLVVMGLVEQAEREPDQAHTISAIIAGGFLATVFGALLVTEAMRALVPWWSVVVANGIATVGGAAYLTVKRPGIWRRMLAQRPNATARLTIPHQ